MRPALSSAARPEPEEELLRMRPTAPATRSPLEKYASVSASSPITSLPI
jgi:hypothetical protein